MIRLFETEDLTNPGSDHLLCLHHLKFTSFRKGASVACIKECKLQSSLSFSLISSPVKSAVEKCNADLSIHRKFAM